MITLDWAALGLGAGLGILAGAMFFGGLAVGMRIALRGARPAAALLLSAVLRIAAVLSLGWWVAGHGGAALAGFALAFVAVRTGVLLVARNPADKEATRWS